MQIESNVRQQANGVLIRAGDATDSAAVLDGMTEQVSRLGIDQYVESAREEDGLSFRFRLRSDVSGDFAPEFDTLQLRARLQPRPLAVAAELEQEIVLAMLLSPVTFEYPSYAEFAASVRIRHNIVEAARRTALAFHTSKIERPEAYWTYAEEQGFTLRPDRLLIDALRMATQPEVSGQLYSFSCYRATEYVIVLGIAQELAISNPDLLDRLQQHWESRAIMSRKFHDAFLREYGSMSEPLPPKYYVPGDRVWFRNPDERSSDVEGYEGSWVIYLGGGLFTNFWKRDRPYSVIEKCVEIYHWRSGIRQDGAGTLKMDEEVVEACVHASMNDPAELALILERMMRLRDPGGRYADGGCIDATREYPRWVCRGTSDIVLPEL